MEKYQNGKIYVIKCKIDPNLIYVGSTIRTLNERWGEHKSDYIKKPHTLLYSKINELKIDNFFIELYELYPCNSKKELNKKEGEVIRKIGTLKLVQNYEKQEHYKIYYEKNKEKKCQNRKIYYQLNKEKIKEQSSIPFTCICGSTIQICEKARHNKSKFHQDFIANNEITVM